MENNFLVSELDVQLSLQQIKEYMEKDIAQMSEVIKRKNTEIKGLKEELKQSKQSIEGNTQLINKLLGDLSKLQVDIDWYRRTYEKRSLLGTIREKLFRKH